MSIKLSGVKLSDIKSFPDLTPKNTDRFVGWWQTLDAKRRTKVRVSGFFQ
jgi:hypothetical protein